MSQDDWTKVEGMKEAIIEGRVILDPWWIEDLEISVKNCFHDIDPTEEELIEILYIVQERFDASIGINWDFIEIIIQDYYEGRTTNE